MRAMRFVVASVLACGAAAPLALAQNVSVNATITGEVVPGVYGRVMIGNQPPPPVVYAQPMIAEPPPVADAFPTGLEAIQFLGSPVDKAGRYTIVGSASGVPFQAPPELVQFLFGTTVLTDVEFAIEESGVLLPN